MVLTYELCGYLLHQANTLDQLELYEADVDTYIKGISNGQGLMSLEQVAYFFGAKSVVIREAVRQNILVPSHQFDGIVYFNRDEVYAFKEKFISFNEATTVLKRTPLVLNTLVRRGHISPFLILDTVDRANRYTFLRSAVNEIKHNDWCIDFQLFSEKGGGWQKRPLLNR